MEKTYRKDWCILITHENKKKVKSYLSSIDRYILEYFWTVKSYYGITKNGDVYGHGRSNNVVSDNIITDKEFDEMIAAVKDNYEIY